MLRRFVRRLRGTRPVAADPAIDALIRRRPSDLHGDVLEERRPLHAERFGGSEVTAVHVVDAGPYNRWVTHLADLGEQGALPAERFDCVILPNALDTADPATVVGNGWRSLRPGGVLLAGYGGEWAPLAAEIGRSCPGHDVEVIAIGDRLALRVHKAAEE